MQSVTIPDNLHEKLLRKAVKESKLLDDIVIDLLEGALQDETDYLLSSETMKKRLFEAKNRQVGLSLEQVIEKLAV